MSVKIQIFTIFTKLNSRRLSGACGMYAEYTKYSYSISNKQISTIQAWIDSLYSYKITPYYTTLLLIMVVVQSG